MKNQDFPVVWNGIPSELHPYPGTSIWHFPHQA